MNILYLSSSPMMGLNDGTGYSTHISELIEALKLNGAAVLPQVAGSTGSTKHSSKHKMKSILPSFMREKMRIIYDLYADYKFYSRVKRAVFSFKPDFIYERYVAYHRSGIKLQRKLRKPLIIEVNAPLFERNLYYNHSSRRLAQYFEKKILSSADAIVVVSRYLKNYILQYGINNDKIHIIPNAADCDKFNPAISGDKIRTQYGLENKIIVGFIGRIGVRHKLNYLLEIIDKLIDQNDKIHLLIVGDGSKKLEYENYVRQHSLSKFVTFTGSIIHSLIPQYIAACDILIIPDTGIYCSPVKLFEYMAMGKAIIAPKLATIQEIVTHNKEAYLFERGNLQELAAAILLLGEDKTMRNQLGANARLKVTTNHTWQNNAARVLQIYKTIKE